MKDAYDVIVVGGGPSGAVAARFAAEGGASVLLIEKRQEVGDPIRCAEGVGTGDLDKYLDIEDRWIAAPIKGATIYVPGAAPIKMRAKDENQIYGYILERKIFDRALVERAAKAGVEVYTKTSATGLIMKDGRVAGVKIKRLGEEKEVMANVVIGADGVESKVGRWGGINTTLKPADIETGVQYLMTGIDIDEDNVEFFMGSEYAPGGYVWIFPKGKGRANVGIGLLGSKIKEGGRPIDFLNRFVESRFPNGKIIEMNYDGVPVSGGIDKIYGAGLMLVGDAAQLSDPITGGGIKHGLWSGELAGRNAAEAVASGDFSEKSMKKYQKAWEEKGGKIMSRDLILKNYYIDMSDEEATKVAQAVEGVDFTGVLDVSQLVKILAKVDKKLLLKLGANQLGL
ncbi:NAD(P)/FAD-dependent oxidoreductase [Methanimicrococcus blatticola]|uniref:Digeranylgeranylglycerophospholipid reductase n=1 Tax=Methanimicrococcus blatticola TaxID=91560 RepID=A0A484F4A2_9EURY|nr:NAD(P)/FAD-dependent oxidoreductase [Methanimicrococcus blatticola]MBZ3935592.1 NAD(P)/FAD-dependent oxidoreductase [Methanimicrococcus blatticola]MCC2509233.1 NAD(P)/FAD-dependent oxidoreductase [Methanimicrococcus blatticola]TDQ69401.1 2,3-di-O-geranylgeranylglyceryl phosphate reductase [Methanimicrococcus blatticola]